MHAHTHTNTYTHHMIVAWGSAEPRLCQKERMCVVPFLSVITSWGKAESYTHRHTVSTVSAALMLIAGQCAKLNLNRIRVSVNNISPSLFLYLSVFVCVCHSDHHHHVKSIIGSGCLMDFYVWMHWLSDRSKECICMLSQACDESISTFILQGADISATLWAVLFSLICSMSSLKGLISSYCKLTLCLPVVGPEKQIKRMLFFLVVSFHEPKI